MLTSRRICLVYALLSTWVFQLGSEQIAKAGTQPEPPPFYPGVCCHGPNNAACQPATDVLEECYNVGFGYIIYANCTPNPCPGNGAGACCFGFNQCLAEVDPNGCANFGGTFVGPGSTCNNSPCNIAACCFASAPCQYLSQTACDSAGGTLIPFSDCSFSPCGLGSCCTSLTACTEQTAYNCVVVLGRTFVAFSHCNDPIPGCTYASGACCYSDSFCELGNQYCGKGAGVFYGVGSTCETIDCTVRACCFANGSCTMSPSEQSCISAGGLYLGGDTCAMTPCGVNACCIGNTCTQVTYFNCSNSGGFNPAGPGTACSPGLCGAPSCPCGGDVNGDGQRNGRDIKSFVNCAIQAGNGGPVPVGCDCADVTDDNFLDSFDVYGMVLLLLGGGC